MKFTVTFSREVRDVEHVRRTIEAATPEEARAQSDALRLEFEANWPEDAKTDCGDADPWSVNVILPG